MVFLVSTSNQTAGASRKGQEMCRRIEDEGALSGRRRGQWTRAFSAGHVRIRQAANLRLGLRQRVLVTGSQEGRAVPPVVPDAAGQAQHSHHASFRAPGRSKAHRRLDYSSQTVHPCHLPQTPSHSLHHVYILYECPWQGLHGE